MKTLWLAHEKNWGNRAGALAAIGGTAESIAMFLRQPSSRGPRGLSAPWVAAHGALLGVVALAACPGCGSDSAVGGVARNTDNQTGPAGDALITSDDDVDAAMGSEGRLPYECARQTFQGERLSVNLHLVVDISASMKSPISEVASRWDAVRDAVSQFLASPQSTGLNIALSYYPQQAPREVCAVDGDCDGVACYNYLCVVEQAVGVPVPCRPSATGTDEDASGNCGFAVVQQNGDQFLVAREDLQPTHDVVLPPLCLPSGLCSNESTKLCLVDEECVGGTCGVSPDVGICPGANSCEIADYSAPAVEIQALPGGATALIQSLAGVEPDEFALTPTHIALQGAYAHSTQWITSDPTAKSYVVLATDGFPLGCALVNPANVVVAEPPQLTLEALARGRQAGLNTFVIGVVDDAFDVGGAGRAALGAMAQTGGTNDALIVTADDTTADGFLAALSSIRGQVLPCEFTLPKTSAGATDPQLVNVEVAMNGQSSLVPRVDAAEACVEGELGWHFDVPVGSGFPSSVVLCPQTCQVFSTQADSHVDVVLGCKTVERAK